jgi:hypothetical protein
MRCDVKISYDCDTKSRVLDIRRGRKTQTISVTMDLFQYMKNPLKQQSIRGQIEEKLKPLMTEKLKITDQEIKIILDEFLESDID